MMELAMIEKLLARSGKMRDVVAAHQPRELLLPLNRQPSSSSRNTLSIRGAGFTGLPRR